jgi:hypothetical protein
VAKSTALLPCYISLLCLFTTSANTRRGSPSTPPPSAAFPARQSAANASNSLIQSLIAAFVLSIFSCVGRLRSTLESAIPTLARASFRVPPLDKFRTAVPLAFMSVAKTSDLRAVGNRASIAAFAAFAAFNSSSAPTISSSLTHARHEEQRAWSIYRSSESKT